MPITDQFVSSRRVGVPHIWVETADPQQTIESFMLADKAVKTDSPVIQWDSVRGMVGLNEDGVKMINTLVPGGPEAVRMASLNATEFLSLLTKITRKKDERTKFPPDDALIFMHNAHLHISGTCPTAGVTLQAIWNLRDGFKSKGHTLVMLSPGARLPPEIMNDVMLMVEPLPDHDTILKIIQENAESAGLKEKDLGDVERVVDTLIGLPAFPAEQAFATSIRKENGKVILDRNLLWERKRVIIEQTPGLTIWRGGETFEDIGGCDNIKGFMTRLLNGKSPPRCIVFMDEIDKAFAGSQTDTSGVSQDYLGTILQFMQDRRDVSGMIFVGPPGAAKSAIAKASGNVVNIPTIAFDLNGMKGSLVGESEARLRAGLKVVDAISQGSMLFIATCNSMANLPSPLRRRFTYGTYFFDLPTKAERDLIWQIYYKKYNLPKKLINRTFDDSGWTGSEIKQACIISDKLQIPIDEAANYIVPVSVSAEEEVSRLRMEAENRFISAAYPGSYKIPEEEKDEAGKLKRRYRT